MPRRIVLTARQRSFLFDLPTDEASLLRYYTLADDDIVHIRTRRKARNRLGFALQLCAFRYPGRFLTADDTTPAEMVKFIAAQLGMHTLSGKKLGANIFWSYGPSMAIELSRAVPLEN